MNLDNCRNTPYKDIVNIVQGAIDRKLHPGVAFREIQESFGLTQGDTAKRLCVSRGTINQFCNGKRGLSASLAIRIAIWTHTTPQSWMRMQSDHELSKVKDDVAAMISINKIQPLRYF